MLDKKSHALNSETSRFELLSPEGRGGKQPSEYAWVSWNLFQSIYSQSPVHISAGPQLPAPSNYLQPSTTWPLPSPMVAPSNVDQHFKVFSFFSFFPLFSILIVLNFLELESMTVTEHDHPFSPVGSQGCYALEHWALN